MTNYPISLQISLSPGDISYAHLTVPKLAAAHSTNVSEKLAVIDCCRPQRTKFMDPAKRFQAGTFEEGVAQIQSIATELVRSDCLERAVIITPDEPLLIVIRKRYLGGLVRETHDCGGCGFISYFAAIALPHNDLILHYDADMLLFQEPNYDWGQAAAKLMQTDETVLAATPRLAPPPQPDAPTAHPGCKYGAVPGGWQDSWFSTRCFLIDRRRLKTPVICRRQRWLMQRFRHYLFPAVPAWRVYQDSLNPLHRSAYLYWRLLTPVYPPAPEIILSDYLKCRRQHRLILSSKQAWLLHPAEKSAYFSSILPELLQHVNRGICPKAQLGIENVLLDEWRRFLAEKL